MTADNHTKPSADHNLAKNPAADATTHIAIQAQIKTKMTESLKNESASRALDDPQGQTSKPDSSKTDMAAKHPSVNNIKLTGRMLNFTRLTITGDDIDVIMNKIKKKLGKQLQSKLPVVVSCEQVLDLAKLWQGLWDMGLQPIGVVTGLMDEQAIAQRIAIFPADGQRIDAANRSPASVQTAHKTSDTAYQIDASTDNQEQTPSKLTVNNALSYVEGDLVHTQMLRSGQSINHVGGDVILTRGINAGAEAITNYSLHVYGKAEGRLVAGATGDKNAKIFCMRFNPSLVSVAGIYCLKEDIPAQFINQAVIVSYADEQGLNFALME